MGPDHRTRATPPLSPDELTENRALLESWLVDRILEANEKLLGMGEKVESITLRRLLKEAFELEVDVSPNPTREEFRARYFYRNYQTRHPF